MTVTVSTDDDIGREEVLAIYSANGWSAAKKPSQLISALRNSHSLVTARDGDGKGIFTAGGTYLVSGERILVSSGKSLAAFIEYDEDATRLAFSLTETAEVSVVSPASPRKVTLDGVETAEFIFDGASSIVTLSLPAGSGTLEIVK